MVKNYIILAAGMGTRLSPLTQDCPKSLHIIDPQNNTTIIQRMIEQIHKYDSNSKIIIVVGFKHELFSDLQCDYVTIIYNPFFKFTNSIASLWFAKDYLTQNIPVTIINADVIVSDDLFANIIRKDITRPTILYDGSIGINGDYNVQIDNNIVVVMSKELATYDGEYAGITKLDPESSIKLFNKMNEMINNGQYDQWYENALVKMIFEEGLLLYATDISSFKWVEIDDVNDLVLAKSVIKKKD